MLLPGEGKDVKDKLLHLDAVGLAGLDLLSTRVHKGNLLDCNMLLQLVLELPVRWEKEQRSTSGPGTALVRQEVGLEQNPGGTTGSYSATSSRKVLVKK